AEERPVLLRVGPVHGRLGEGGRVPVQDVESVGDRREGRGSRRSVELSGNGATRRGNSEMKINTRTAVPPLPWPVRSGCFGSRRPGQSERCAKNGRVCHVLRIDRDNTGIGPHLGLANFSESLSEWPAGQWQLARIDGIR